jgi:hypothetical protein
MSNDCVHTSARAPWNKGSRREAVVPAISGNGFFAKISSGRRFGGNIIPVDFSASIRIPLALRESNYLANFVLTAAALISCRGSP